VVTQLAAVMDLLDAVEVDNRLSNLTDLQVAELLLTHVWAGLDMTSAKSALVSQAVERLKRARAGKLDKD
jgi:hypothetical protein